MASDYNWVEVWAEDVSKTGFTVVGRFHNNGQTHDPTPNEGNFRLYVDGTEIHRQTTAFSNGQNITWSKYYNAGESASSRSYTIKAWWDSSGFGWVSNNEASTTVTVSASQYSAKAPTSVVATCSGTTATVTWSHGGSESAYPLSNFSVSKDGFATSTTVDASSRSTTFSGLDLNTAYTFEVCANGSAGNSSRVSSNTVYTTPEAPTNVTGTIMALPDTAYNCVIKCENSAVSPSGKLDIQYSTNKSTWYGPNGSASTAYSLNGVQFCEINDASATALDATLKNIFKSKRTQVLNSQAQAPLYFRVRVYNSDNTTASSWSKPSTTVQMNLIAKMYVRIPDDKKTFKNLYFYTPDATKTPKVYFKI